MQWYFVLFYVVKLIQLILDYYSCMHINTYLWKLNFKEQTDVYTCRTFRNQYVTYSGK